MGRICGTYGVIQKIPEGKRPLGRPRRIWEDNIKMDLREVDCDLREILLETVTNGELM